MKKTLSLLFVFVLCLGLVACGGGKTEEVETEEDKVQEEVKFHTMTYCIVNYDSEYTDVNIASVENEGSGKYIVKGKAKIRDGYGDEFEGKFDAVVEKNADEYETTEFEMQTPRKIK